DLSKRALGSLERFMRTSQAPVVLVSPPTQTAREMTALALNLGAVGVVRLPSRELVRRMPDVVSEMLDTVKAVARGRPRPKTVSARAEPQAPPAERAAPAASAGRVLAVGASAVDRRALRLGRRRRRVQRRRRDPDRHGSGRRARPVGDEARRRPHARPGRVVLRRVRYASRGDRARSRRSRAATLRARPRGAETERRGRPVAPDEAGSPGRWASGRSSTSTTVSVAGSAPARTA